MVSKLRVDGLFALVMLVNFFTICSTFALLDEVKAWRSLHTIMGGIDGGIASGSFQDSQPQIPASSASMEAIQCAPTRTVDPREFKRTGARGVAVGNRRSRAKHSFCGKRGDGIFAQETMLTVDYPGRHTFHPQYARQFGEDKDACPARERTLSEENK